MLRRSYNLLPSTHKVIGDSAISCESTFCLDMAVLDSKSKRRGCLLTYVMHSTLLCSPPTLHESEWSDVAVDAGSIWCAGNVS